MLKMLPFLILGLILFTFLPSNEAILDVMVDGREVQRFLFDIYIVKNGRVSPVIKNPAFTKIMPVIQPNVKYLELKFASSRRVQYSLSMTSSNELAMKAPTANIPWKGRVPKTLTAFKVFFPCTGKVSAEVLMTIHIDFYDKPMKHRLSPVNLSLRRRCKADRMLNVQPRGRSDNCPKSCEMNTLKTKFCISDFVVRGKVEKYDENNGTPRYLMKITRRFKRGRLKIKRKNQIVEIRGSRLTCSCKKLDTKGVYLLFGREDRRDDTLFLDDHTVAMPWGKRVKKFLKTYREKLNCPPRLAMYTRFYR